MKKLVVAVCAVCFFGIFNAMAGQSDSGWKWGTTKTQSSPFCPLGTTILYHEDSPVHITIANGGDGYCFVVRGSESGDMSKGVLFVIFTNKGGYNFAAVGNATYQARRLQIVNGLIEKCDTTPLPQLTGKNDLPDYATTDRTKITIGSSVVVLTVAPTRVAPSVQKRIYGTLENSSGLRTFDVLGRRAMSKRSVAGFQIVNSPDGVLAKTVTFSGDR